MPRIDIVDLLHLLRPVRRGKPRGCDKRTAEIKRLRAERDALLLAIEQAIQLLNRWATDRQADPTEMVDQARDILDTALAKGGVRNV